VILSVASDGDINVGLANAVTSRAAILDKTGAYVLTTHDSRKVFTSTGASGTITLTLPAAALGLRYTFIRTDEDIHIDPDGTETIGAGGAGKYLDLDAARENVTIQATTTGRWEVISYYGWGLNFEA